MEVYEKQGNYNQPYRSEKKITAGILGILLGGFGVHKFYLGYTKAGIIQLVLGIVTCGVAGIVGFIEGIIYLTKSDEEFDRTYVQNQKEWF
jgi:TM2 domain-containing membrane protein YozV